MSEGRVTTYAQLAARLAAADAALAAANADAEALAEALLLCDRSKSGDQWQKSAAVRKRKAALAAHDERVKG